MARNSVKTLLLAALAFLAPGLASAQTAYPLFAPADGILVGDEDTFITTPADSGDVIALWGGTCSNLSFLRGDGQCQLISALGGNPTGTIGLTAVNGSAATFLRSDGAPALSQAIAPTWTGLHTFTRNDDWAYQVSSTTPVSLWIDTSPPAPDTGKWALGFNAGEAFILGYNDLLSQYRAPWVAARTVDYNVDYVQYNATSHRFQLNDRTTRLGTIDVDGSGSHQLAMEAPDNTGSVYVGFYEPDGTTRKGHVGYGAPANDILYLWQEEDSVLAVISEGDIIVQTDDTGTYVIDVANGADEWTMANDGGITHLTNSTSTLTMNGTVNNTMTALLDNDSNGTANAVRYSLSSGDSNAALFTAGSGRTSTVLTGGPVGAQTVLRNLGSYPIIFGTNNTARVTVNDANVTNTVAYISAGTTFGASGCSVGTLVGGVAAGRFTSGTTGACSVTVTLPTAPNGWACAASNQTTANLIRQSASTTTSCTITGTTVSGDVISFQAMGY